MQSYQNVSNSQLLRSISAASYSCKRFCKVIKMLAIHNRTRPVCANRRVANAFAKLSKCQQFTTLLCSRLICVQLQTLLQSYQNVSNSQRTARNVNFEGSCKRFCKVIKMLAIHNISSIVNNSSNVANAFAKLSKCQQFTT